MNLIKSRYFRQVESWFELKPYIPSSILLILYNANSQIQLYISDTFHKPSKEATKFNSPSQQPSNWHMNRGRTVWAKSQKSEPPFFLCSIDDLITRNTPKNGGTFFWHLAHFVLQRLYFWKLFFLVGCCFQYKNLCNCVKICDSKGFKSIFVANYGKK